MSCPKAKTKETKTRYLTGRYWEVLGGRVGIVWNHEFLFSLFSSLFSLFFSFFSIFLE